MRGRTLDVPVERREMASVESYETAAGKRYRVQYRTPDRRNTMKRGFRTKREAEQYLASVEVSKLRGEWVDPTRSRATVGEMATQWLDAQVQIKTSTLSGYRYSLDRHILPRWGTVTLLEVTHGDVQAWVGTLSRQLEPSTVRQIYLVLAGILKFAVRDGRMPKSPAADIQLPRIGKRKRGYLTHQQVAALANECGSYSTVVFLLAYTGLRWGEMAALTWECIDGERKRLEVVRSLSEVRGELVLSSPKNHERRSVPIPQFVVEFLAAQSPEESRAELIFRGADGAPLRAGNFRNRVFNAAVLRCQATDTSFPRVTPHDLRHTAASLAVSAGANVKAVQRMLGHASAAMTLDVYADLFDDDLDAVATVLDDRARAAFVVKM
jgi:integrase